MSLSLHLFPFVAMALYSTGDSHAAGHKAPFGLACLKDVWAWISAAIRDIGTNSEDNIVKALKKKTFVDMQKSAWIAQVGEYTLWQSSTMIAITGTLIENGCMWAPSCFSFETREEKKRSLHIFELSLWFPDTSPGHGKKKN